MTTRTTLTERDTLRSAIATTAAALTPEALDDHWGMTSRADELSDVLSHMREMDAGIYGLGHDDHDALEWLRDRLYEVVFSCELDAACSRELSGGHPSRTRVWLAARTAARKLALIVGDERLLPLTYAGPALNVDPAEADRIVNDYLSARGLI